MLFKIFYNSKLNPSSLLSDELFGIKKKREWKKKFVKLGTTPSQLLFII